MGGAQWIAVSLAVLAGSCSSAVSNADRRADAGVKQGGDAGVADSGTGGQSAGAGGQSGGAGGQSGGSDGAAQSGFGGCGTGGSPYRTYTDGQCTVATCSAQWAVPIDLGPPTADVTIAFGPQSTEFSITLPRFGGNVTFTSSREPSKEIVVAAPGSSSAAADYFAEGDVVQVRGDSGNGTTFSGVLDVPPKVAVRVVYPPFFSVDAGSTDGGPDAAVEPDAGFSPMDVMRFFWPPATVGDIEAYASGVFTPDLTHTVGAATCAAPGLQGHLGIPSYGVPVIGGATQTSTVVYSVARAQGSQRPSLLARRTLLML